MRKKTIFRLLLLGMIVIVSFSFKYEASEESSNSNEMVSQNIEALLLGDLLGRHCSQGCMVTGDPNDACTQCGQNRCFDYIGRKEIGDPGNCPVKPE